MQFLKNILFSCIAFLITLTVCEFYVKTTYIASVTLTGFDPEIGKTRRKNIGYLYFNEGFAIGKINEFGYIGEPCSLVKSENTVRIALMGDSFIESFQIFERNYFGNIARMKLLERYPGKNFEFLNFGCAGFEMTDMYAYQKMTVEKMNPDFIFYMISNDDLIPESSDPLRPVVVLKNDQLEIKTDFNPAEAEKFKRANFLMQHSAILSLVNDCRTKAKTIPVGSIILDKFYPWFSTQAEANKENIVSNFKVDPVLSKIVNNLDPQKVIIINRDINKLPIGYITLFKDNGLRFFDLSPLLTHLKDTGNDPQQWEITKKHGHWNFQAHEAIGEEVADIASRVLNP